jgi:hypothetical protein
MSRYNEFGGAAWQILKSIRAGSYDLKYRCYLPDDASYKDHSSRIAGLLMGQWWDASEQAGSKSRTRPNDGQQSLSLAILAYVNGVPTMPESLLTRFAVDTIHGKNMKAMHDKHIAEFPPVGSLSRANVGRVSTGPDYSRDGPDDSQRIVDLESIPADKIPDDTLLD